MRRFAWISYAFTPIILLIKFSLVSLVLYIGIVFCNYHNKVSLGSVFKIVIASEIIFVCAGLVKFLWFYLFAGNYDLNDLGFFYPLSLINFFKTTEISRFWIFPLQTINLFHMVYIISISYGLNKVCKIGKPDADKIDLKNWRLKIGIIPQEIHIFNGTILQNLLTELTESKIKEMISTISGFGLSSFIDSFPSGLMTLVGEEGINLSGGQKQLLAFIRVLIKKPDILVIDEGTSNMDRRTEGMIMNLITRLKSEMGILLISHRINMIKNLSDFIYVIEGRSITNKGTHNDLIKADNLYKRFWDDFY